MLETFLKTEHFQHVGTFFLSARLSAADTVGEYKVLQGSPLLVRPSLLENVENPKKGRALANTLDPVDCHPVTTSLLNGLAPPRDRSIPVNDGICWLGKPSPLRFRHTPSGHRAGFLKPKEGLPKPN